MSARPLLRPAVRAGRRLVLEGRRLAAGLRMRPDFLLIGAQKAGTSSLFAYLAQHPGIAEPYRKEVHFFDLAHLRGEGWYRAFFPLAASNRGRITGEATPYYLFHPRVPALVHAMNPGMRLIVLLRDPVDRAVSHYAHAVRKGLEHRPFEEALEGEPERMAREEARLLADPRYRSEEHQHRSYLSRGRYLEQLRRWTALFPREQLLVLRAEDLFADPAGVYGEALAFLRLAPAGGVSFAPRNVHPHAGRVRPETRELLVRYYAEPNERLEEWLGRPLGWARPTVRGSAA